MTSDVKNEINDARDVLRRNFSQALSEALVKRFGRLPSATLFANQYNFRAHGAVPISRETARKWMVGLAIPEMPRLNILIEWLELDTNKFLASANSKTSTAIAAQQDDLTIQTILELLRQMDSKTRSVVLITAWALRETNSTPLGRLNLQALKRTLISSLATTES
jgi:hypothetical protein